MEHSLHYMQILFQSFIHDFRWLSQPDDVLHTRRGKRPTKSSDLELSAVEEPAKLPPQELGNLISINPRDPSFFKESPELAKKYVSKLLKVTGISFKFKLIFLFGALE